jgi:hypothetical protein
MRVLLIHHKTHHTRGVVQVHLSLTHANGLHSRGLGKSMGGLTEGATQGLRFGLQRSEGEITILAGGFNY